MSKEIISNFQILLSLRAIIAALVSMGALGVAARAEDSRMGLFLEPSLTYETGDTSVAYPSPFSNSSGKVDGLGVGARIGLHFYESFFAGLDARYSMPQFKDSSVTYDAKSIASNWGPLVGMQMPNIGLRVWGTLILGGELDPEKSGSLDVTFREATGFRIGTGFRVSMISLNLEYQQVKYNKATLEQIGPFSPTSTFDSVVLDNKSWIVSVSFPLEL